MADQNMQQAFTQVYETNEWQRGSGLGSQPDRTRDYRQLVEHFIEVNGIRNILDIGCGDWASSRYIHLGEAAYTGIDVVQSVIDANRRAYAGETFICGDALAMKLPVADLLICKDVLQHWTNDQIWRLLDATDHIRFRLFTNTTNAVTANADLAKVGEFRPVDLSKLPFNMQVTNLLRYQSRRIGDLAEDEKTVQLVTWGS